MALNTVSTGTLEGEFARNSIQPLPQEQIDRLPVFVWASGKQADQDIEAGTIKCDDDCPICQEEAVGGDEMCVLPCRHTYHKECIAAWLQRRANCPTCRYDVLEHMASQPAQLPGPQVQQQQAGEQQASQGQGQQRQQQHHCSTTGSLTGVPTGSSIAGGPLSEAAGGTAGASSSMVGEPETASYLRRVSQSTDVTVHSSQAPASEVAVTPVGPLAVAAVLPSTVGS